MLIGCISGTVAGVAPARDALVLPFNGALANEAACDVLQMVLGYAAPELSVRPLVSAIYSGNNTVDTHVQNDACHVGAGIRFQVEHRSNLIGAHGTVGSLVRRMCVLCEIDPPAPETLSGNTPVGASTGTEKLTD